MWTNKSALALALVAVTPWAHGCAAEEEQQPRAVPIEDAGLELTEGYCAQMFECSCDNRRYEQERECGDDIARRMEELRAQGESVGLTYDPGCLGAFLDSIEDHGCSPEVPDAECQPPCQLYFGMLEEGEACQWLVPGRAGCAQGLRCNGEICIDPCRRAAIGESCDVNDCGEGLLCGFAEQTPDTVPTCIELPGVGDPCPLGDCSPGSSCEQDPLDPSISRCTALMHEGEPCTGHPRCTSGYCPRGVCEAMPLKGAPCPVGACAPGLRCDAGVCNDADGMVCWSYPPV